MKRRVDTTAPLAASSHTSITIAIRNGLGAVDIESRYRVQARIPHLGDVIDI